MCSPPEVDKKLSELRQTRVDLDTGHRASGKY